jgi:hypothetical protein
MLRMQVGKERWAPDGSYVEVPTQDKMNRGRGALLLLLRKLEVENLSPYTIYFALKQRAERLGVFDTIWCTDDDGRFLVSSLISRLLRGLITEIGISVEEYTAYSFRHTLITYLVSCELSETEANAFTGHSHNSHTALTHYFHLDQKLVGSNIASGALQPIPAQAARLICDDNSSELDIPAFLASPTAFAKSGRAPGLLASRPPRPP